MKFQFEVNDVVTIHSVGSFSADDYGFTEEQYNDLLQYDADATEFVVESVINEEDNHDVIIGNADDRSIRFQLDPEYLVPTPETLNGLLGEYGLDM